MVTSCEDALLVRIPREGVALSLVLDHVSGEELFL